MKEICKFSRIGFNQLKVRMFTNLTLIVVNIYNNYFLLRLKEIKKFVKSLIPKIDEKFLRIFQSTDCLGVTPIAFNASRRAGRKSSSKTN